MTPSRPPSIDAIARSLADTGLPHPLLVDAARRAVATTQPPTAETAADGEADTDDDSHALAVIDTARTQADALARTLLQPVVNATGVILHTNLGRAPLAHHQTATATNLEIDLSTGARGSRQAHAAALLARAANAEQAIVVNNGAAAALLALAALARERDVVVSRGELVEIGGGFRIPEVLATAGCRLVEVGTTNRTRRDDYRNTMHRRDLDVAAVLKVHPSNYRISGFTESVGVSELADLVHDVDASPVLKGRATTSATRPALIVDLGSGLLDETCPWLSDGPPPWLAGEPGVRQALAAGADLVTFSGDKLLGGPQAGILCGRGDLVEACQRHPLARALRPGSLVLGALQDVALSYLHGTAAELPLWRMATAPVDELRARASAVIEQAGIGAHVGVEVVELQAAAGGGTLPGVDVPSAGLSIGGDVSASLRSGTPPVIARVRDGRTLLDFRTIDPSDDVTLATALAAVTGRDS